MESQQKLNPMNLSAFSLNKKFNTMELLENQEDKDQKRSTSLGI